MRVTRNGVPDHEKPGHALDYLLIALFLILVIAGIVSLVSISVRNDHFMQSRQSSKVNTVVTTVNKTLYKKVSHIDYLALQRYGNHRAIIADRKASWRKYHSKNKFVQIKEPFPYYESQAGNYWGYLKQHEPAALQMLPYSAGQIQKVQKEVLRKHYQAYKRFQRQDKRNIKKMKRQIVNQSRERHQRQTPLPNAYY